LHIIIDMSSTSPSSASASAVTPHYYWEATSFTVHPHGLMARIVPVGATTIEYRIGQSRFPKVKIPEGDLFCVQISNASGIAGTVVVRLFDEVDVNDEAAVRCTHEFTA
jgi:hypothetical protein